MRYFTDRNGDEYGVKIHGAWHEDRFPGAGSAGSFAEWATGIGSTSAEALEDAFEQAATFLGEDPFPEDPPEIPRVIIPEEDDVEGVWVYVTVYWGER